VWESRNQLSGMGTDLDIFMSRSIDDGMTWSPPEAMNNGADTDELDENGPEIAADRNGRWVMTWRSPLNAIVSRRSENGGETWLPISPVALQADGDTESPPELATDGLGNWVAAWHSHNSLNDTIGTDGDIAFSRSTDGGASWSVLAPINTDAATDSKSDEVVHLAADQFGNWIAVWFIFDSPEIYAARSNDGGATWLPPELISADTGMNFSLPQIGSDFRGTWYAIWASNNGREGDLDLLYSTTTDVGAGWTLPEYLNTDAEADLGDDYLARIVFDRRGNGVAAWSADNSLGGMNGEDGDVLRAIRGCE
jgi:Neuraminidase (sialidase)